MIKYRIEKQTTAEDLNVNIDLQNILQELTANLKKQDRHSTDPSKVDADDESQETEEDEDEEDVGILTAEMEQANNLYHQAMKLINGTGNRQYPM